GYWRVCYSRLFPQQIIHSKDPLIPAMLSAGILEPFRPSRRGICHIRTRVSLPAGAKRPEPAPVPVTLWGPSSRLAAEHASAGSSRHRQKIVATPASAKTRPELHLPRRSSNANSLCGRNSAGSLEICATFQRDILRRHL